MWMIMREAEDARGNSEKLRRILHYQEGSAYLYRKVMAGPSGQRADQLICAVSYTHQGPYELRITLATGPFRGIPVGYAARVPGTPAHWTIWELDDDSGRTAILGYAESVAIGADVLINGVRVAMGRHDSSRTSRGLWVPKADHVSVYDRSA